MCGGMFLRVWLPSVSRTIVKIDEYDLCLILLSNLL